TACDAAPITTGPPIGSASTTQVTRGAADPNDLAGPGGFGPDHFVQASALLPYQIQFENESNAPGSAGQVQIKEQLDSNLDWSTFQLGDFGFGGIDVQVPPGRQFYQTRLDEQQSLGLFVDVTASLDPISG